MPRINQEDLIKTLSKNDSISAVGFYDGEVTKTEVAGEKEIRVTIGEENFLIDREDAEKFNIRPGKHMRGFMVSYSVPDDGCTVFYFNSFHPR